MDNLPVLVKQCIETCIEKKVDDVRVYPVSELTPLVDFLIVMSVANPVHLKSTVETIKKTFREATADELGDELYATPKVSGDAKDGWVAIDLNLAVVHVFTDELRQHYALDTLYSAKCETYYF